MKKIVGMILVAVGVSGIAMAYAIPEIDPGMAGNGLALLAGALLIIHGRRRR